MSRSALVLAASFSVLAPTAAIAQAPGAAGAAPRLSPLDIGLVLDGGYTSRERALGSRDRGFALGHNELTLRGNVDNLFSGRATLAFHEEGGRTEFELEEAFLESRTLPRGLQVRAGRFLSQVGYLNERHTHTDDFIERPLLYKAFLGRHYFDDGVRLNWVAPTSLYWRTGVELMSGRKLVEAAENSPRTGVLTLGTKVGGDLGVNQSWQLGASYLRNKLNAAAEEEGHDEEAHAGHDAHGARYIGRNLYVVDAVWKWAPNGNNRERQVRVSTEYARATRLAEPAAWGERHQAWYVAAVYQFAPQWEAGVRLDDLQVRMPHEGETEAGRLKERSLALAWKPSHFSTLRLQWSHQRNRGGFDDAARAVQLQYVVNLGAHGAHSF